MRGKKIDRWLLRSGKRDVLTSVGLRIVDQTKEYFVLYDAVHSFCLSTQLPADFTASLLASCIQRPRLRAYAFTTPDNARVWLGKGRLSRLFTCGKAVGLGEPRFFRDSNFACL